MAADGPATLGSTSLLLRLKHCPQPADWCRFVDVYGPLIYSWAVRNGLQPQDGADLTQEVLAAVATSLDRWQQDAERGPFRAWLWAIARNKLCDLWRGRRGEARASGDSRVQQLLNQVESPESDSARNWDQEYQREVLARMLRLLEPQFTEKTWQAFRLVAVDGLPAPEAAARLGMTLNAVYVAKSRVLARLRQEVEGLLD